MYALGSFSRKRSHIHVRLGNGYVFNQHVFMRTEVYHMQIHWLSVQWRKEGAWHGMPMIGSCSSGAWMEERNSEKDRRQRRQLNWLIFQLLILYVAWCIWLSGKFRVRELRENGVVLKVGNQSGSANNCDMHAEAIESITTFFAHTACSAVSTSEGSLVLRYLTATKPVSITYIYVHIDWCISLEINNREIKKRVPYYWFLVTCINLFCSVYMSRQRFLHLH